MSADCYNRLRSISIRKSREFFIRPADMQVLKDLKGLKTTNKVNPEVILMSLCSLQWLIEWENIIVGTTVIPKKATL